jgi:polysaccharide export outer membrane protein
MVSGNLVTASVRYRLLGLVLLIALSGCSGSGRTVSLEDFNQSSRTEIIQSVNQKLKTGAVLDKALLRDEIYKLGAGDLLEVSVFRVDELNRSVRVNGAGNLVLPLLGPIQVAGRSSADAEIEIAARLLKEYLQDPQVSIFVKEYRSQEVTVMGAVNNPDIYNVTRTRGVVEMLSMAGGVSESAADTIRVSTVQTDPQTGKTVKRNLVLSINGLLSDREALSDIRLSGGDAIFVPEAGVVYVEGAVEKPGAYKMSGDVNVLQAISMAGGIPWAGNQSKVKVVREISGKATAVEINLNKIRQQTEDDVVLQDGDIVIVNYGSGKRIVSGFVKGVTSFVGFGYNLNR